MVPVGTVLGECGAADTPTAELGDDGMWHGVWYNDPTRVSPGALNLNRRILRLGPAAEPEAPAEVDRSGWPVLVLDGVDYYRWPTLAGRGAVWVDTDTGLWTAYHDSLRPKMAGDHFPTAREAADALKARLPDEAAAPHPSLLPKKPGTVPVGAPIPDPRDTEIATLRERAEKAEAEREWLMDEVCRQTDATRAEVVACMVTGAAHKPVVNARMGAELRKRFAVEARATNAESTLSTLRGQLAFLVPSDDATDAAIVAAAKALADHANADGQDDTLLTAGLGLLDQAALGNPTLGYVATVIRRGVGQ